MAFAFLIIASKVGKDKEIIRLLENIEGVKEIYMPLTTSPLVFDIDTEKNNVGNEIIAKIEISNPKELEIIIKRVRKSNLINYTYTMIIEKAYFKCKFCRKIIQQENVFCPNCKKAQK
jgi:hypothetical protein